MTTTVEAHHPKGADLSGLLAEAARWVTREPARALNLLDQVIARATARTGLGIDAVKIRSNALFQLGRVAEALVCARAGAQWAADLHDPVREARCRINEGVYLCATDQWALALACFERGFELSKPGSEVAATACLNAAQIAERLGQWSLWLRLGQAVLPSLPQGDVRRGASLNCGVALLWLNRPEQAVGYLHEALSPGSAPACATGTAPDVLDLDAQTALASAMAEQHTAQAVQALCQIQAQAEGLGLQASAWRAQLVRFERLLDGGSQAEALRLGLACEAQSDAAKGKPLPWHFDSLMARAYAGCDAWEPAYQRLQAQFRHDQVVAQRPVVQDALARLWRLLERVEQNADPRAGEPLQVNPDRAKALGLGATDMQLLVQLAHSRTNAQAAAAMSRSANTVRNRLSALMKRLGARSRGELLMKATALGLLHRPQAQNGPLPAEHSPPPAETGPSTAVLGAPLAEPHPPHAELNPPHAAGALEA